MKKRNHLAILLTLLLVVAIGLAIYFYWQYRQATQTSSNEARNLAKQLARVIELPDEKPTIATVNDETKLQAQPFFQHAKKGDKVLIFPISHKALLYRPATDKIIDVATLQGTE